MELVQRLLRSESLIGREQEFYWLWICATVAYGVGDIVTTITILEFGEEFGVRESNLLIQQLFDEFGQQGIIALKISIFLACLTISLYAAEKLDWPLYYTPPVLLTGVGTVVTVHNLRLLSMGIV